MQKSENEVNQNQNQNYSQDYENWLPDSSDSNKSDESYESIKQETKIIYNKNFKNKQGIPETSNSNRKKNKSYLQQKISLNDQETKKIIEYESNLKNMADIRKVLEKFNRNIGKLPIDYIKNMQALVSENNQENIYVECNGNDIEDNKFILISKND